MDKLQLSQDDAVKLLCAIIRRALLDVRCGSTAEQLDAEYFLDWLCPRCRQRSYETYGMKWQDAPRVTGGESAKIAKKC